MYYEKPYYRAPAKGGAKVYSLLRQALSATGKVAVATFVMHQRQHLCVVAPSGPNLMLLTLRFADEIVPESETAPETKVTPAELTMAKQLVEKMSGNFNPKEFKDTYHADLKRRVQEKVRKKETHSMDVEEPVSEERPKAEVINLMEALKASLAKNKGSARPHRATRSSTGSRGRKRA
jgi:DNA end-binding protein Ku